MTDPVIRLDSDRVAVEPGGQAQIGVTISNPGSIVEGYTLDVVGEGPASWAQVIPAELSIYPQQEARAIVTFAPPSGNSAPSGTSAFGVRARSTVDPDTSAVAEGDVEIGKVFGLQAKIIPVTSSGRWRGRHVVQLSNWGNAPATLRMVASDPDAALGFYVRPDVVELPLGGSATVRMSVRTRKPFLRGNPVRLPFTVVAERADAQATTSPTPAMPYADPGRPVVDGAFTNKPILSAGFIALLSLVLAALVGLIAYLVLQPKDGLPGLGSAGPPPKPELAVEAKGPNAVLVSWEAIDGVETYNLFVVNPDSKLTLEQSAVPAGQNGMLVEQLQPETTYCYQLSAVRGGQESPRSDEKCARTDAGPPPTASPAPSDSATPPGSASVPPPTTGGGAPPPGGDPSQSAVPPGGSVPPGSNPPPTSGTTAPPGAGPFAGGKWIAVADLAPEGAAAQPKMAATVGKLGGVQPPAVILRSADYPTMKGSVPLSGPTLMAAVGPFDTAPQAQALCPQIKAATGTPVCLLFQPQP